MKPKLQIILVTVAALLAQLPLHAGTVTYTYDSAGRLRAASYTNGWTIGHRYDPAGNPRPAGFLAVDITASDDDAATELDSIAELCESGSRADMKVADGGFVCRFDGDGVYAALVRGGRVVTVASSAVPPGTTAARLAVAFTQQLTAIGKAS